MSNSTYSRYTPVADSFGIVSTVPEGTVFVFTQTPEENQGRIIDIAHISSFKDSDPTSFVDNTGLAVIFLRVRVMVIMAVVMVEGGQSDLVLLRVVSY